MAKPLPKITFENEKYWAGLREGKLLVQRCLSCHRLQFYPRFFCGQCYGRELEWYETKGIGTIYTFTVIRRPPTEDFKDEVPYIIGLVELEEGVRIMARIVHVTPENCVVGLPVKLCQEYKDHDMVYPAFLPIN